jgi:hypothetical protein
MKTTLVLTISLLATPVFADDCCFYPTPPVYYQNREEITKIDVITRQIGLSPAKKPYKDELVEYALQKQWEAITSAIPIPPAPQPLRQFQFSKNWPKVAPAQQRQRQRQTVQTETVTQVLTGIVNQSVVVTGGVVIVDPLSQRSINPGGLPHQ